MPSTATAKRLGKRFIGYPEKSVPVVSSADWVKQYATNPKRHVIDYLLGLFPILTWLPRYNFGWLTGDLIAGLTVGMVVVPQGMSYAQLATLPAEYGLYSSFVGVLIYCFFATSKDVSIGPVAVMSLTVAQVIKHVEQTNPGQWTGPVIASTLALITGFIVLGIGLLRLGWLVEFIPAPAVSGFMTGSAISIAAGQVPGLMGITGFDTRAATYRVIINTLRFLPRTKLDAAWGLTGLVGLYSIRILCDFFSRRYPRRARIFFFISVLRNAFVILILTLAAWLYCRPRKSTSGKYPIKILQTVPAGFKHIGQPSVESGLIAALAPELPVATIILLLEHIAISKSFGRLNGYKINPNQELIAIGVTNTIGSCFGAYPATGSFSRSALKSKSGVRTPAAGIVTSIIVIVALYGLTPAFYYIPTAGLSAVIIHAVADLVASPSQVYSYWRVSPLEFFIWAAAVLVTIFSSIENGIYTSIASSLALLLIRLAHPRGSFLGKVTLRGDASDNKEVREVFVPLKANGVTNPHVKITPPSPGVIVYRFEESYLYPNSSLVNSALVDYVKENTRRGKDMTNVKASDRPWNDPGPSRNGGAADHVENEKRPSLHAVVLDFSLVSHIDTTAVQALIDARTEIDKWADHPVEFHFATILSPWIHRALTAGGFGLGISSSMIPHDLAAVVPYRDGRTSFDASDIGQDSRTDDLEGGDMKKSSTDSIEQSSELEPIVATDTPFFHIDLQAAVRAAESGVGRLTASD
ncbi:putative sulfate permease C3H7.02 [Hypsizygus marmoreus]|uniref:Sulfate permease C3H7.02 n=1 Tax=Hypsizygus marmoreus TaxID=39966 RepID=A0A369JRP5_HYPMA|nr:putative sulfate permease C3H7.02 [Hypsizygus marmoreus]